MNEFKHCMKCGELKNLSEFYFNKTHQKYFSQCKVCYIARQLNYYQDNRIAIHQQVKTRYHNDPNFKAISNSRSRLHTALNRQNATKSITTIKAIGCTIEFLTAWLEFTKMFYCPNSIKTEIDHLRPLSHYDLNDSEELLDVENWRNLRRIDVLDNRRKSGRFPTDDELTTQQKLIYQFLKINTHFIIQ